MNPTSDQRKLAAIKMLTRAYGLQTPWWEDPMSAEDMILEITEIVSKEDGQYKMSQQAVRMLRNFDKAHNRKDS